MGEFAFQLIKRAIGCEFLVIISEVVIEELEKHADVKKINSLLHTLRFKIKMVYPDKEDMKLSYEIKRKYKIPYYDACHYILSKKTQAILVTNDKHLLTLSPEIKKPNEL